MKIEAFAENGDVRPGRYDVGRIMYDVRGEMAAQLMRSTEHAYFGYFGSYTIDAQRGVVVHHVVGASQQTFIGTDQVRYYRFSDDRNRLMLSVKSGDRVTQTLTWERAR